MRLTSLYLVPEDPESAPPRAPVQALLETIGLIGAALDADRFRAGPRFGHHLVFAGCSPHLVLEPPADGSPAFCHVALHGPAVRPWLVTGPNTVKPRCPACRTRFADWREQLPRWRGGASAHCPGCGAVTTPCALDWRQHAVCGRFLIEVRHVFPGEAVPGDGLLQALARDSGTAWHYGWAEALLAAADAIRPAPSDQASTT